jgi:F420-non-reducing hydrogenase small subunit
MSESPKIKLNTEWLSVCGGCHVAVVDLHEKILVILGAAVLQHCPVLTDIKDYPKADVGLISGAIRNEHDRDAALHMRKSCDMIIALGTCAVYGGIPGAGMVHQPEEILDRVYVQNPTTITDTPPANAPYELEKRPIPLDEVIDVDLYLPGCPPHPSFIFDALLALVKGRKPVALDDSICARCRRKMEKTEISGIRDSYGAVFDPELCFLSQGCICLGSVTLDRCLAPCPTNGVPCTGCSGPTVQVLVEPNRDLRTEIAQRMSELTNIEYDTILRTIERESKSHYAYAMASDLIRSKPTFLIEKWIADVEAEKESEPEL